MCISLLTCKYGKHFFKMTNSAIFHDNEVLLNPNIRLTMCLFENKWINKEKNSRDFSLNCYLNFEKRQKKKNFPKWVPCWYNIFIFYNPQSLLHESQTFILLYLYIFLHSYRKTFEFKFCMFSNTSGKVLDKATNLLP